MGMTIFARRECESIQTERRTGPHPQVYSFKFFFFFACLIQLFLQRALHREGPILGKDRIKVNDSKPLQFNFPGIISMYFQT